MENIASYVHLNEIDVDIVREYAEASHIDYRLILAMIKQESQFDQNAESERGRKRAHADYAGNEFGNQRRIGYEGIISS